MRTFKINAADNSVVVEIETDSISDTQDNMTIHDIRFLAGDKNTIISDGFKFMVPNVITRKQLIDYATAKALELHVKDVIKGTSVQLV